MGDTGRGSEGRANAGFVVTRDGVVVIDAEGSPRDGATLLRTIRSVSQGRIRWLVLTHHHPDHHFGAVVFRKAGAKVIAHPDARTLASEGGLDNQMIDWIRVVGLDAMRGFEYADAPDRAVTRADTLRLGGRTLIVFAPKAVVPGHGALPAEPGVLIERTRAYMTQLRGEMRAAVQEGVPMKRALDALPPADENRPVSMNSRRRRNAARVYVEEEKDLMGLGGDSAQ